MELDSLEQTLTGCFPIEELTTLIQSRDIPTWLESLELITRQEMGFKNRIMLETSSTNALKMIRFRTNQEELISIHLHMGIRIYPALQMRLVLLTIIAGQCVRSAIDTHHSLHSPSFYDSLSPDQCLGRFQSSVLLGKALIALMLRTSSILKNELKTISMSSTSATELRRRLTTTTALILNCTLRISISTRC